MRYLHTRLTKFRYMPEQSTGLIKVILIQAASLILFWLIFSVLQSPSVYHNSLGLISNNWTNENGERKQVNEPYIQLSDDNYVQWDGDHYEQIKNHGYDTVSSNGEYIYAFFPLFPLIWKISGLPSIGILFLNYLFFSISILLLLNLSERKSFLINAILSLSLPGLVIFLIPYTEATFMLFISLGVYGFIKNKYWVYFIAFLLASLTRPTFTFIALSILCVEIFFLLSHKKIRTTIVNFLLRVAPLIVGTFLVPVIQNSESPFQFLAVQKYWENALTIPTGLKDWSHEGFGINLCVIFLISIPLLYLLIKSFIRIIKKGKPVIPLEYRNPKDYLVLLSVFYLVGITMYILLFRGGSLHCLFRFTICSPFIYILLYSAFEYIERTNYENRLLIALPALVGLATFFLAEYSRFFDFTDLGFFILSGAIGIWLFQDRISVRLKTISLITLLVVNLIWTTYLFNSYISNSWIFA